MYSSGVIFFASFNARRALSNEISLSEKPMFLSVAVNGVETTTNLETASSVAAAGVARIFFFKMRLTVLGSFCAAFFALLVSVLSRLDFLLELLIGKGMVRAWKVTTSNNK